MELIRLSQSGIKQRVHVEGILPVGENKLAVGRIGKHDLTLFVDEDLSQPFVMDYGTERFIDCRVVATTPHTQVQYSRKEVIPQA